MNSLSEQGTSGVVGKKKVIPTKPLLQRTQRRPYSGATALESQCPASIDPCYIGIADYDAEQ